MCVCVLLQPSSPKKKPVPPVRYVEGNLVWAKFNRRPWWPCKVTTHPQDGVHTKMKGKDRDMGGVCGVPAAAASTHQPQQEGEHAHRQRGPRPVQQGQLQRVPH